MDAMERRAQGSEQQLKQICTDRANAFSTALDSVASQTACTQEAREGAVVQLTWDTQIDRSGEPIHADVLISQPIPGGAASPLLEVKPQMVVDTAGDCSSLKHLTLQPPPPSPLNQTASVATAPPSISSCDSQPVRNAGDAAPAASCACDGTTASALAKRSCYVGEEDFRIDCGSSVNRLENDASQHGDYVQAGHWNVSAEESTLSSSASSSTSTPHSTSSVTSSVRRSRNARYLNSQFALSVGQTGRERTRVAQQEQNTNAKPFPFCQRSGAKWPTEA